MSEASAIQTAHWFELIDAQLREIIARIEDDLDVPPAQRFQLEGLVAAAHADGVALDELMRFCARALPPACAVRIDADQQSLQFDFWQKRAPVYPSTQD